MAGFGKAMACRQHVRIRLGTRFMSSSSSSWWQSVEPAPKDPILGVTEAFLADPSPDKVNVGVVSTFVSFLFFLLCWIGLNRIFFFEVLIFTESEMRNIRFIDDFISCFHLNSD